MLINFIYGVDKIVNNCVGEIVVFYNNGFFFFLYMVSLLIKKIIFCVYKGKFSIFGELWCVLMNVVD